MKYLCVLVCLLFPVAHALPENFVYLSKLAPSIHQDIRYATQKNFVGQQIAGYAKPICILTVDAALALQSVSERLRAYHLGLKVFDCYRPTRAVDQFVQWSKTRDQINKATYYPRIAKRDVFKLNYVAQQSAHSRGSTVDLTLVDASGRELHMGTHFDYLDALSHCNVTGLSDVAQINRRLLRTVMLEAGFMPIESEWWHFTLRDERYPDTYFNFLVR